MSMLKKALERGLTPSNVISYVCLQIMRVNGAFWEPCACASRLWPLACV